MRVMRSCLGPHQAGKEVAGGRMVCGGDREWLMMA